MKTNKEIAIDYICTNLCIVSPEDLHLEHWLAVLETAGDWDCRCKIEDGVIKLFASEPIICFNLITGQPNSPEDYKRFNYLVGV